MKVFVLSDYDGIQGIYSTRELAEEAKRRTGHAFSPDEYEVDMPLPELVDGKYAWTVLLMEHDGSFKEAFHASTDEARRWEGRPTIFNGRECVPDKRYVVIKCIALTREDAIEIAKQRYAESVAEQFERVKS